MFGFNKKTKDGRKHRCKVCDKLYGEEYYKRNKSKISKDNKEWYKLPETKNRIKEYQKVYHKTDEYKIAKSRRENTLGYKAAKKSYDFKRHLSLDYDMTVEQYQQMFDDQCGRCKICETHQSELNSPLNIDHCHKIGTIRGLLCVNCNHGLGCYKDSKELLLKAIEYLS